MISAQGECQYHGLKKEFRRTQCCNRRDQVNTFNSRLRFSCFGKKGRF